MEMKHYDVQKRRWILEDDYDARGITLDDGRIRILPRGIESPDMLAQTIYHETAHWLNRVAAGQPVGDVDRWRSEVVAYDIVLEKKDLWRIGDKAAENLVALREQYQYQVNHPERQGRDGRKWLRYDTNPSHITDDADVDDADRADPINDVVEQAVRERRQAADRRKTDLSLKTELGSLAQRVCDDPSGVTQEELNGLPRPSSDFTGVSWPPPPGLARCASDLYFTLTVVIANGPLEIGPLREKYALKAAPLPPVARAPVSDISQFISVPALIRAACDSPESLDDGLFRAYLRGGVMHPREVVECRQPRAGRSACFRALLSRICSWGDDVPMTREYLLALAQAERQRLSEPPPTVEIPYDPSGDRPQRPDRGEGCFQDPGSPRGCPK